MTREQYQHIIQQLIINIRLFVMISLQCKGTYRFSLMKFVFAGLMIEFSGSFVDYSISLVPKLTLHQSPRNRSGKSIIKYINRN